MLVLIVAACGGEPEVTGGNAPQPGDEPVSTVTPAPPTTQADEVPTTTGSAPQPDVPAVDVVALRDDSTVDLRSLVVAGRPTLLWFWAPHCSFCRREAPKLLAFKADHGDDIDIIGVGAQDSLDEAYAFLDDTATGDLPMVWDATGKSWVHYGVTNQPTVILLGADGQIAGTWFRDFATDEILAASGLA